MDWTGIHVRIDWRRSGTRRWPPTPTLAFTPQVRRKQRNVLLYWWAGQGQRQLPNGTVAIGPETCHWARPGWSYFCTQNPDDPLGVTSIHFDLIDADGNVLRTQADSLPSEQLRVNDAPMVAQVTRWIAERAMDGASGMPVDRATDLAANQMLRGLLIELDEATRRSGKSSNIADLTGWQQITAYIHEHLHDLSTVEGLAFRAGYTRSHFSRAFRAQLGLSPQQYIINARTSLAMDLLRSTPLSITEIAYRAGYGDVFCFSRQFRQRTSLTPSQYREQERC